MAKKDDGLVICVVLGVVALLLWKAGSAEQTGGLASQHAQQETNGNGMQRLPLPPVLENDNGPMYPVDEDFRREIHLTPFDWEESPRDKDFFIPPPVSIDVDHH